MLRAASFCFGRDIADAARTPDKDTRALALHLTNASGRWVLVRIKHNRDRESRTNWLLIKQRDEYAKAGGTAAIMAEDHSVASGRSMDQIARGIGKRPKRCRRPRA